MTGLSHSTATQVGIDPDEDDERDGDETSDRSRWRESHGWFVGALLAGALVSVVYLETHAYPAYGAGLYLEIATQIRANGYALPASIPNYAGGIPFAYPPLQFYVTALLLEAGVPGLTVSRVLPAVLTVLYLIPYYGIALELLPTRRQAGVATALLALAPPALQWHLSAGGIVRGAAFFLALCGIYAGCRMFRYRDYRWALPGAVLFGLTVLSHPTYTVFFGLSWLVLFFTLDRTVIGFFAAATVALGGVALSAPWWFTVVRLHGVEVFTAAAGSHSGLAGGVGRLLDQFVYPLDPTVVTVFFLAVFGATVVLLVRGSYVLPLWLVAGAYVVGKERFQFVAGSMIVATVALGLLGPTAARWRPSVDGRRVNVALACLLVVASGGIATAYAAGALDSAHHGSQSLPAFLDDDDMAAMAWVADETRSDATFVVLGDAAEWFPYYTDRPILVGPWGVEWVSADRYYDQLESYEAISTCETADCVTRALQRSDVRPDYLYVPTGGYTVRGLEESGTGVERSLAASDDYERVYGNDGVTVFRVTRAS